MEMRVVKQVSRFPQGQSSIIRRLLRGARAAISDLLAGMSPCKNPPCARLKSDFKRSILMRFTPIILLLSLAMIAGCKTTSTTQPPADSPQSASGTTAASPGLAGQTGSPLTAPAKPKLDACALLTSREIEAVQGEAG